jgi:four helix bundle protein
MDRPSLEARTQAFAAEVFRWCRQVQREACGRGPADQLARCATSVAANYRASGRARSRAEFRAKLTIVAEEADEAVFWLEFATEVHLGHPQAREPLLAEGRELRAICAAACRTLRAGRRERP